MVKIIDIIDSSHILEKISRIPKSLIIEIISIMIGINLIFGYIYYQIYLNDKTSFKNIHNLESKNVLSYFDFLYFSSTTFYSLGYDLVPQSKSAKILCIIQMKLSFIITTVFIAKIINGRDK